MVVNGASEDHRGRCTSMSVVSNNPVLTGLCNSAMFADSRLGSVADDARAGRRLPFRRPPSSSGRIINGVRRVAEYPTSRFQTYQRINTR